jgi:methylmalonyl-CoA mutase
LSSKGSPTVTPGEVIRATEEEKQYQIDMLENLQKRNAKIAQEQLRNIQKAAIQNDNLFAALMEATNHCSLGQLTAAMFEVGGQYRRNM